MDEAEMARELSWVQYAAENVDDQNHSSVLIVFIAAGCVFALFVLLQSRTAVPRSPPV